MAIELEQFAYDAKVLDLQAFIQRHGDAFIVRSSADGQLTSQEWSADETKPSYMMSTIHATPRMNYKGDKKSTSMFSVYLVRKTHRLRHGIGITVGRKGERDIVIADTTVSALHAVIDRKDGEFFMSDKASRNGTLINSDRLEPGKAVVVPESATLQFGRVRMSWMRVAEFLDFVNTMM